MKKIRLLILILATAFLTTSCYDKVELEDRALVISMGIDEDKEEFKVSMEIPSSKEGGADAIIKKETAPSLNSAIKKIDSYSGQKLYYGHTKACVIGEDILKKPKLFKEMIDGLERNREISRKLILLCAKNKAEEIYEAKTDNKALKGIFINDFYKNNRQAFATTFRQDLESVIQQLLSSSNTVLPVIKKEKDELRISEMAVIKNYELKGFLNEEESRGYLWLSEYSVGGEITVPFEDTATALKVTKKETTVDLSKNENGVYELICKIKAEGNIEEYTLNRNIFVDSDKYKILQGEYSEVIEKEAQACFSKLQEEFKADALGFGELLRKNYYEDYEALNGNTENAFEKAQLKIEVSFDIKGAGAIK